MKRIFLICLAALLLWTAGAAAETVTVTDMMGREIAIDSPVKRVVALTAADCEILYALGAGDLLVGRGEYCDYPEEVTAVPSVQSGSETNVEQILALEPQVVLTSTMAQALEQITAMENAGIAVVESAAYDIEGAYASIRMIGQTVDKADEAEALVAGMEAAFAEIAAQADGAGEKTVYFEVSPLEWGLWTAGGGTFMNEFAEMMGVKNAFADVTGWAEISQEQVIERNPDYIVTISAYYGEGPRPEEEIAERAGWQGIKAVQNGAIYNADANTISRPGPRLVEAARALFDFFY